MVHYPVEFPYDSARVLIKSIKDGTLKENIKENAEAAWNLQGYAQFAMIGDAHTLYKTEAPSIEDDEVIADLLTEFNLPPTGSLPFDAKTLFKWALKIINTLLD
jgi:hypothetical protein